jgi:hypothetical protein
MKRLFNVFTYVMLVCVEVTIFLILLYLQSALMVGIKGLIPKIEYPQIADIITLLGFLSIQGLVIHYSYRYWKTNVYLTILEHDVVVLIEDFDGIKKGMKGTIVHKYGKIDSVEVEFIIGHYPIVKTVPLNILKRY